MGEAASTPRPSPQLLVETALRGHVRREEDGPRVLLISMPWAQPVGPSLALGLLKSLLVDAGIPTDVLYANLAIGASLPYKQMLALASSPIASLLTSPLMRDLQGLEDTLDEIMPFLSAKVQLDDPDWQSRDRVRQIILQCDSELDAVLASIPLEQYDIVGFSLMFEQTPASIAMARRMKRVKPDLVVVLGGASCDGDMGPALLEAFPEIDYVVSGEADETIAPLIGLIRGGGHGLEEIPGLSMRKEGRILTQMGRQTGNLDALPTPDYRDYFQQLRASQYHAMVQAPLLPFEASRGCWWGQEHLCTFCGLNGNSVAFRRKGQERVVAEIMELAETYQSTMVTATDNILDREAVRGFIPTLAAIREQQELDLTFFFEVKTNLNRRELQLLAKAGVRHVQPGVESFSDHVLKLMGKGASGVQQLQFVKWCEEVHITPVYNILVNIPGTTTADYEELERMVPFVRHLRPPNGSHLPVRLQRFSPYYDFPDRYGIRNVRPADVLIKTYRDVDADVLRRLVYYFDYEHDDDGDDCVQRAKMRLVDALASWIKGYLPGTLTYRRGPGFVRITDRRAKLDGGQGKRVIILTGAKEQLFTFCDTFQTGARIRERFAESLGPGAEEVLSQLVSARLLWRDGKDRYLALPIHARGMEDVGT